MSQFYVRSYIILSDIYIFQSWSNWQDEPFDEMDGTLAVQQVCLFIPVVCFHRFLCMPMYIHLIFICTHSYIYISTY